jgi:septum formation protein
VALLVLASASPRRAHLLRSLGLSFEVKVSGAVEELLPGESPDQAAERLARAKAAAVAVTEARPVLAADTLVECDGHVLGKPTSPEEARHMLRLLSGRTHQVVTGVCLVVRGDARSAVDRTRVTFAPLSDEDIDRYVASGEPLDKAGAYHVDGRGALFITRIVGSPSNVAGLPLRIVYELARAAGLDLVSS